MGELAVLARALSRIATSAIAAVAIIAGGGSAVWAQSVELKCDDRANDWDNKVVACSTPGKLYAQDEKGWRDGVIVELRGVPKNEDGETRPRVVSHYWFAENGWHMPGKYGELSALEGVLDQVRPDDTFTARLYIYSNLFSPGRYRILFRINIPCKQLSSKYEQGPCTNNRVRLDLPEGFYVDAAKQPPSQLLYHDYRSRTVFASATVEVRPANERPAPDTSRFKLTCLPDGQPCVAGARFSFDTGGPYRYLRGSAWLNFYKKEAGGYDASPFRVQLTDDKGDLIFNAKDYQLKGFGTMPGEGTWQARLQCFQCPAVVIGEYQVGPAPKQVTPPTPPRERLGLNIAIKARNTPSSYDGPFPTAENEVVPGTELHLLVTLPETARDGRPGDFEILLDGNRLKSASGWWQSVTLPEKLAEGPHRLTIRADDTSGRRQYEGQLDIRSVPKPRIPQLRVEGPIENDREIEAVVTGLEPPIELWSVEPHSFVKGSERREGTTLRFKFTVPIERVWDWGKGQLAASVDSTLTVNFRQPLGTTNLIYENRFKLVQPIKVAASCRHEIKPVVEIDPSAIKLRRLNAYDGSSGIYVKIAGFPCGDPVRVQAVNAAGEKIDLADPLRVGPRGDKLYQNGSRELMWFSELEKLLKPRKPEKYELVVKGDSGQEARQSLMVTPVNYIEVAPERPRAGQQIQIRPFGFQANTYVRIFLEETPLTYGVGKPLEAGQPVEVRLPEGIVGRKVIRLADNAGNGAQAIIEIEGEGSSVLCKEPCIQLPQRAKQGEQFDSYIGGFERNEQLTVRFGDLFEVGKVYQGGLQVKFPILIPRSVKDGRYRVTVTAVSDPGRMASRDLEVQGGYQPPTLVVACPRTQPNCEVARFKPGESVNTTGLGWSVKGQFSGTLISDHGRQPVEARDGCRWAITKDGPIGAPCDESAGEISKFWALPKDLLGGAYVIELSDGAATARAGFWVDAETAPAPKPVVVRPAAEVVGPLGAGRARPGDRVEIRGKEFPPRTSLMVNLDKSPARIEGAQETDTTGVIQGLFVRVPEGAKPGQHTLDIVSQVQRVYGAANARGGIPEIIVEPVSLALTVVGGAVPGPTPTPAPGPKPEPTPVKTCNPELPRIWQPGCVEASGPTPGPQPTPAPAPTPTPTPTPQPGPGPKACNPELPRIWQPGCVDTSGPVPGPQPTPAPVPKPEPTPVKACNPELPRIWQPGCVDGSASAPAQQPAPSVTSPTPPPKAPTGQAPVCDPNRPRYSQPGCVEAAATQPRPDAGAGTPRKCDPNIPKYAQPGCIP